MKKSTIASLIGLAFTSPAFAAEMINLDNVVVTAARVLQTRESVIADVTVIDAEEIQRGGQTTLVELLQLQPGIEISSNGGAGKTTSVFMRGSNSDHTVVLVDGLRMASATTGTTAFENFPLDQIDRIEILRGPATSLYGQDAIGGVIQIFTKKGSGKPQFYASVGYGTYNTKIAQVGVHGQIDDTSFALNLSGSDIGGFSALNTNRPNFNDNDGYKNVAINASIMQKLAEGHEMGVQLFNSNGNSAYDNSFNATNFSSKVKMQQQGLALTSKNQFTSMWLSSLKVGFSKDKSENYDELGFFNPANPSKFNTEQTQINWQNDLSLPVGTLTLMYDRLEDEVSSTTAYDKTSRVNEGYVASYLANIGAQSVQLSLRDDHNSQFGSKVTGNVGYGYNFSPVWRATASYGTAYKAPTFNELYYPFFGNAKLNPEQSRNLEASLRYKAGQTSASATIYQNRVRDLTGYDSNYNLVNINQARLQGLTLSAGQRLGDFDASGNADFQSPTDEKTGHMLARRANRHGALNVSYNLGDWRFGAEATASSLRYNTLANTTKLAGYALLNFTATYKVNQDWTVQARANNVLDKNYVLAIDGNNIDYSTPGANLFVNFRYQPE